MSGNNPTDDSFELDAEYETRLLDAVEAARLALEREGSDLYDLVAAAPEDLRIDLLEELLGLTSNAAWAAEQRAMGDRVYERLTAATPSADRVRKMRERIQPFVDIVSEPMAYLRGLFVVDGAYPPHSPTLAFCREAEVAAPAAPSLSESARIRWELWCDDLAEHLLERAGLERIPTDLTRLAEYLNLLVQEAPMEGLEGCLLTDGQVGAIMLNSRTVDARRKRFTLAHEISHHVLHSGQGSFQDTDDDLHHSSSGIEMEASTLAARLLMPPGSIRHLMAEGAPSLQSARALMDACDVSLHAACRHMVRHAGAPCAFVISKNNQVIGVELNPRSSDGAIRHPLATVTHLVQAPTPAESLAYRLLRERSEGVRREAGPQVAGWITDSLAAATQSGPLPGLLAPQTRIVHTLAMTGDNYRTGPTLTEEAQLLSNGVVYSILSMAD